MISTFNKEKATDGYQIAINLRDHLHIFKGAKLAVFISLALHANIDGLATPSVDDIHRETGYNTGTIYSVLGQLNATKIDGQRVLRSYQATRTDGSLSKTRYQLFPSEIEKG